MARPLDADRSRVRALGVLLAAAMVTGGCGLAQGGTGGDGAPSGPAIISLQVPSDPGPGCGDAATTDPGDLRPDRQVARCASGTPAPRPLERPAELKVAIRARGERLAPLLLADHFGELAAENVTVDLVEVASLRDAYRALGEGDVDVVAGDLHAAFFDLVMDGNGAQLALGGPVSSAAGHIGVPQAGLWVASRELSGPNRWNDLEFEPIIVQDGIAGATTYPLDHLLDQGDASLNDFQVVQDGGESAAEQLGAGAVPAAWLDDPHWRRVAKDERFRLAATRPREAIGGLVLHERLLDDGTDRDVGLALVRAVIRTINTYLGEDYRSDTEVARALLEVTGWSRKQMEAAPPYVFDWELREGTLERIQGAMMPLGAVLYPEVRDDEVFVDTSLYREVVGAAR